MSLLTSKKKNIEKLLKNRQCKGNWDCCHICHPDTPSPDGYLIRSSHKHKLSSRLSIHVYFKGEGEGNKLPPGVSPSGTKCWACWNPDICCRGTFGLLPIHIRSPVDPAEICTASVVLPYTVSIAYIEDWRLTAEKDHKVYSLPSHCQEHLIRAGRRELLTLPNDLLGLYFNDRDLSMTSTSMVLSLCVYLS